MAKRYWVKVLFLYHYSEGIPAENEIQTPALTLSRDDPVLSRNIDMSSPLNIQIMYT